MAVNRKENMEDESRSKNSFLKSKMYARNLSKDKLIYARDGDVEDTVIIRCFYPSKNNVFGMKGTLNIEAFFQATLKLIDVRRELLKQKSSYIDATTYEKMFNLCDELKLGNIFEPIEIETVEKDMGVIRSIKIPIIQSDSISEVVRDEYYKVSLSLCGPKATFYLCYLRDDEIVTGIYLFTAEMIKLLRYLNSRFEIEEFSSFRETQAVGCKTDDFF